MSLQTVHLSKVIAKQYRFKFKAYIDVFSSLVGIQFLAIIFSTLGSTSSTFIGVGNSGSFHIKQYSSDLVIMFTFMWMFVTAVTTTMKQTRYQDFSFVGTRLSSSISSILFLVTAAAPAAIFAMLSGYLIRSVVFIFSDTPIYGIGFSLTFLVTGIISIYFYMVIIASIGYLIGAIVQFSKIFLVVVPAIFLGAGYLFTQLLLLQRLVEAIIFESSLLLFSLKALIAGAIFFTAAIVLLRGREVRI